MRNTIVEGPDLMRHETERSPIRNTIPDYPGFKSTDPCYHGTAASSLSETACPQAMEQALRGFSAYGFQN